MDYYIRYGEFPEDGQNVSREEPVRRTSEQPMRRTPARGDAF